jgi:hypothetical protein
MFLWGFISGFLSLCLLAAVIVRIKPQALMTKTMDFYFKVVDKRNDKILKDAQRRKKGRG